MGALIQEGLTIFHVEINVSIWIDKNGLCNRTEKEKEEVTKAKRREDMKKFLGTGYKSRDCI